MDRPPRLPHAQHGFIPLLICVFLFVVTLAYLVYVRVMHAQQ